MASEYRIEFQKSTLKTLNSLPRAVVKKAVARIETLKVDPRPSGCVKLSGRHGVYRVRSGEYRIPYEIADDQLVVIVVKIGHRRQVY